MSCGGAPDTAPANNPLPVVLGLTPSVLHAGSAASTIQVSGESFIPGSHVLWDGIQRPTRYTSPTSLAFDVSADDLARMDTAKVTVVNPAPGGGTSGSFPFIVGYPLPVITTVDPSTFSMAAHSVFLTVNGSGFSSRTLAFWDTETGGFFVNFMSPTQIRVQIPDFEYPTARTYTIRVYNPAPGGGYSNAFPVIVTATP